MVQKEIVFISNFLGNGGAARVISILAEEFAERNYSVCIYSFIGSGVKYELNSKIKNLYIPTKKKKGLLSKFERILSIRRIIKAHPNATIISFEYFVNMQTIVASLGLQNKIIISERNDPMRRGGEFPLCLIRNFLYRLSNCLVCQTIDAQKYFPPGIQKMSVIIENPLFNNLPNPYLGVRKKVIVNFCRIEKQKNLKLLIDAFKDFHVVHSEYNLKIYGDGNDYETIEKYITENNASSYVHLHHGISNIHQEIIDSAMFVSSSNYEGLSNSMIEAMALGIPTIATDCPCGGARTIIKNEINGILVPVGDKTEMVVAMNRICSDETFAKKLSENAIKIRERLSVGKIASKWEKLL